MTKSTRIRYLDKKDGTHESQKTFLHPTKGEMYRVILIPAELTYKVIETISSTELGTGKACNMHQVKAKAKKKLEELGIAFDSEVRKDHEADLPRMHIDGGAVE